MSTRRLEVVITGDTRSLNRAVGTVSNDMGRMESSTRRAGRSLAMIGKGGVLAGVLALGAGVKIGTEELLAQEKASARTANVLETTGGVANITAEGVERLASALQSQTGTADDAIQSSANLLLTFTKVRNEAGAGNDVFNQGVAAANNMSVALGTDLNAASLQVGKALNDPIKGVAALQRAGVSFTQQQKDQIKEMQESGNILGAQKLILGELETQFGGAAAAEGELTESLQQIQRAGEDMAEGLAAKVMPRVVAVAESFKRNWPQIRATTEAAFRGAQRVVEQVMAYYRANIAPTISAIVSAARGFWRRFGSDITNAFNLARRVAGNAMRAVAAVITGVLAVLRGDWSTAWNSLKTVVQSAVDSVKAILTGLPGIVFGIATGIGKAIADGVMAGLGNIASRVRSAITDALGAFDNTPAIDPQNLTGRGPKSSDSLPGSKSEDARGSSPSSPNFALARVPVGSSTDLSRTRSRGDRNADAARRRATTAARKPGVSEEDIEQAGERAYIAARRANLKNIRTRINARRKNRVRELKKFDINARKKVKVPGPKYPEKRQKALDRRASMKATEQSIRDELESLAADYADAAAQLADLGEQVAALDRTDEAEAAAAAEEAADAAADAAAEAPTERDFLEANAAEATLTAGTEDDIAAAGGLVGLAERELAAARASGDPRRISAAIQTLRQAQENLEALTANTDAVTANTEAITQAFGGSTVFGYRGQDYGLRSLSAPSSDRLVGAEVGL